jgi:hypothetical protein
VAYYDTCLCRSITHIRNRAVQYATASPIRVVVVTSQQEVSTNIQYDRGRPFIAEVVRPITPSPLMEASHVEQGAGRHQPCSGMKGKAMTLSNKLRQAFGLPLIAPANHPPVTAPTMSTEELKIIPFIGTPVEYKPDMPVHPRPGVLHIAPGRGVGGHRHHHRMPFLHRVHRALMVLGPWEGRAVAFVLGMC